MAIALPESRFVGVDLAGSAIAAGRELIAELGLRNIELHAQDASALGSDFGQFDYVIAHGVYSWVPETVRDGLLATIQARLKDDGVGFVSFSAYPGAYFRQMARELMLFHTDPAEAPTARLGQGIDFLRFVRETHGSTGLAVYLVSEPHVALPIRSERSTTRANAPTLRSSAMKASEKRLHFSRKFALLDGSVSEERRQNSATLRFLCGIASPILLLH